MNVVKLKSRICKSGFINNFDQQRKIMESLMQFLAWKVETEIIPSRLVIEKSTYNDGTEIIPSCYLSRPVLI